MKKDKQKQSFPHIFFIHGPRSAFFFPSEFCTGFSKSSQKLVYIRLSRNIFSIDIN